jgi:hypothetical protein
MLISEGRSQHFFDFLTGRLGKGSVVCGRWRQVLRVPEEGRVDAAITKGELLRVLTKFFQLLFGPGVLWVGFEYLGEICVCFS